MRGIARLGAMRARAESRMTSRCTVRRKTGATTTDSNGFKIAVWSVVHTGLAIRLVGTSRGGASSRTLDLGSVEIQAAVREAHVPATTADLADGDLIEITAGENAGLVLRIVEATWQDQATARRLPVIAEARPKEWP